MFLLGPISVIILIIVIVIVVVAISRAKRKTAEPFPSEPESKGTAAMSVPRRVWLYLVTAVTLSVFAVGIGQLLTLLFDKMVPRDVIAQVGRPAFDIQQLSLGLAMVVIGGPLWFFFWRAIQRRVKGNEEEIGSGIRKIFLNLILISTAFTTIIAASDFLSWLMAGVPRDRFTPSILATMIVAGLVWIYHYFVSEKEGHPSSVAESLRRWYVYILAAFGLVWLAQGIVELINIAVINLPVWGNMLVAGQFWNDAARMRIAWILLGGITWYFHWFRMAHRDFDSTLRQVYFYLLAISGGAIAALVAATILLFRFFIWVFGGTPISVSPHFQFLGWAIPTILVGVAIWGYHRRLAHEEAETAPEQRLTAQRIYYYLMSFIGLGTSVTGLSLLFGVLIDLIINASSTPLAVTAGWWKNQLGLCLALLIVGMPLWFYYWNGILKRVSTGGISEWRATSRRIFLYVIVGVAIVALVADMVNIVYQILSGVLNNNFGADVLRNAKWSLQTLIVMTVLLWYHWQILRADQRRGAEVIVTHKNVTLILNNRASNMTSLLESKLGFKIRVLYQAGVQAEPPVELPEEEINKAVNEIQTAPSNKIMLVALGGKLTVLPYQDK